MRRHVFEKPSLVVIFNGLLLYCKGYQVNVTYLKVVRE